MVVAAAPAIAVVQKVASFIGSKPPTGREIVERTARTQASQWTAAGTPMAVCSGRVELMDPDLRARVSTRTSVPETHITVDKTGGTFQPAKGITSFRRVQWRDVDLSGTNFEGFDADGCTFTKCNFDQARLGSRFAARIADSSPTVFIECRFEGTDLRDAVLGNSRFEGCTFMNAKIERWFNFCAEFVDCRFGGRIYKSVFRGTPYGGCGERLDPARKTNEFRGNDFREADLIDVRFEAQIDVFAQFWPTGPQYVLLDHPKERIDRVRADVAQWADERERVDALLLLDLYSTGGYKEQEAIFTRRDNIGTSPVRERVWEMLATAKMAP